MPNECGARIRHSDFRSGDFDDLCRSRGGWPGRQHRLPIWSAPALAPGLDGCTSYLGASML